MATNKNATIRYQALDRCFRNPGRKFYIEDLIDACNEALLDVDPKSSGIKRRQIYDDIKFMQDSKGFDAPIESFKAGRKAYYRYADINFSINSQPLNEQEAQQLKESLITLTRFKGMPQFEWIEELKARLEDSFKLSSQDNVISFEENPFLTGKEYIGDLYNAITNKQALSIVYRSFKSDEDEIVIFHSYYLKQYNNRWFVCGLNENANRIENRALDRIVLINESKSKYIQNDNIDFGEYFSDVVGVTVESGEEPQKVLLKIEPSLLPYIITKPLHESQVSLKGQARVIQLKVQLNYELESLILSFGEKVEVLEPTGLRNRIRTRVESLIEKYV
ncbi:helix-turn-helix transcriptional regulator [Saccharicrinis fermentans]|uniref:Uncharacterized protein n=1 Tax=Saccharicrinis fermentans DSM 9555 = JCM 21142 TaxID=869213 RepID=W7Y4Q7_9BACT|nr:WYL domain-containing protein [Saccharicrinis fermentans]GAF05905.1 hypothetical protein JCM21142_124664 [Saccharicrinis fermentans DSM 9555 = JCM 21142]